MRYTLLFFLGFAFMSSAENVPVFTFEQLKMADLPMLFDWFSQPYIAKLWVEPKEWPKFKEKYEKKIVNQSDTLRFIVSLNGDPMAYIQYYRVNDEDRKLFATAHIPEHAVGIDLFIAKPQHLNKGLGTYLLKQFIEHIKKLEPNCTSIIIDPDPTNIPAIKCYKKVGFKEIGIFTTSYGPTGNGAGEILLLIYNFS